MYTTHFALCHSWGAAKCQTAAGSGGVGGNQVWNGLSSQVFIRGGATPALGSWDAPGRGEGGDVCRRRWWEASRTNGWRRRFISSLTSVAWLPTLVSDVSDRGGAGEMRWVEAPQPERRHLLPLARPAEVSPAALQLCGKRDLPRVWVGKRKTKC